MPADEYFALWVDRHGRRRWDGPFDSAGRAWGRLQRTLDVQNQMVISGTQMSNTVPSRPGREADGSG